MTFLCLVGESVSPSHNLVILLSTLVMDVACILKLLILFLSGTVFIRGLLGLQLNILLKLHYFQLRQKSPFEIRPKNLAENPCIRKLLILFLSGTFFIKGLLNLLASPRFVPLCYLVFKTKTCFQKVKKMKPILRATEKTLIPQEIRDNFPNFYSLERLICIDVRQASALLITAELLRCVIGKRTDHNVLLFVATVLLDELEYAEGSLVS